MTETETRTNTTTDTAPTPAPRAAKRKKGSGGLWAIGLVIGLGVAFGGAYLLGIFPSGEKSPATAGTDAESVVATVNGAKITRGELDTKMAEIAASYPNASTDPAGDAAFELQVLDEVINLRLLTNEAEKQGITVSDEEVATELASLKETLGGEEQFATELTNAGLTLEDLETNMHNEMLIRKLLEANTDIEDIQASDEEVAAMYEEAVGLAPEGQEVPPLEEVADMARAQLIQQKSAELINAYIEQLRGSADIQVTP